MTPGTLPVTSCSDEEETVLVIRRKIGESLLLGSEIEMEVLAVEGGQVKLGIRAPREVLILRKEIASARDANRNAARKVLPIGLTSVLNRLRIVEK